MKFIHYSDEPLKEIKSFKQDPNHHGHHIGKPRGLWVSVQGEDDWESWCKAEGFKLEDLAIATEVILSPGARIKYITNAEELRAFAQEYKTPPPYAEEYRKRGFGEPRDLCINWTAVAEKYQGIIIAPYIWECRLAEDTFWYYGWDCASGCIWDNAAISGVIIEERHISVNRNQAA